MATKPFIVQGTTFNQVYRWDTDPLVYKAITAKLTDTPLAFTVTGHGLPAAWQVAFRNTGLVGLDATEWPPTVDDFDGWFEATATDANTVALNDVDAELLTGTYTPGGSLVYLTPVGLAGATGQFTLYDQLRNIVLSVAAVLDDTAKTITVTLSAAQTALLSCRGYNYSLELTDTGGAVTQVGCGVITVYTPGQCPCN